jgi:septal ring factor EnvC (AmiA/AmiB activator)
VPPKKLPFFRCGLELKERVDHKWSKNNKGRKAIMANVKKDLQAVTKELKALTKKTERLIKTVDKLEKAQAAVKRKPKAKAKITKKAPARKKAAKLGATDQVLRIIERSKKGVDVPTLMKKTGFDVRKVRNIVFRTFKQGKIKRTGKGIYVGA